MLLAWLLIGFFVLGVVLLIVDIAVCDVTSDGALGATGIAIAIVAFLLAVIFVPAQHSHVLSIPFRIAALERTVEQQKELIAIDATLGQGLEGLEIKQEIQGNISKLNNLIARAEYIAVSPWWMFKPQEATDES